MHPDLSILLVLTGGRVRYPRSTGSDRMGSYPAEAGPRGGPPCRPVRPRRVLCYIHQRSAGAGRR